MLPCTGSDIYNTVCGTHGIFIMLYNDQAVSKITQLHQRTKKSVIIPLMQSDAWFIQNIGNSYQPGTDLGSQTDSLRLAAGKSSCRTSQ